MSYITFKSKLIEQKVKQYLKKKHEDLLVKEGRRVLVKEEGAPLITKMLIHNDDLHSEDLANLQIFPNIKELELLSENITDLESLLACGDYGRGALADLDIILERIKETLNEKTL